MQTKGSLWRCSKKGSRWSSNVKRVEIRVYARAKDYNCVLESKVKLKRMGTLVLSEYNWEDNEPAR